MLVLVARLILGLVFVAAGGAKLTGQREFRRTILSFEVVPAQFAGIIAFLLPWTELILGLSLILTRPGRTTVGVVIALLAAFSVAVTWNLLRGRRHFACGCFGGGRPLDWWLIVRNLGFLCLATALWHQTVTLPSVAAAAFALGVTGIHAVARPEGRSAPDTN